MESPHLGGDLGFLWKHALSASSGEMKVAVEGKRSLEVTEQEERREQRQLWWAKEMSSATGCKSIPNFPFSVQFWETIARQYFCLTKYLEIVYEIKNMQIKNKPFSLWHLEGFLAV